MIIPDLLILSLIYYTIGSIPSGFLISKIFKKNDPRSSGSKNIGATNVTRIHGWRLGFATLVFDISKAWIPLNLLGEERKELLIVICSISIFLGHLFPVWLKFKGGKGVAVFIGILFSISIEYGVLFLLVWLIIFLFFKYSSLSAIISTLVILITILLKENNFLSFLILFFTLLILFKHKDNIIRLIKGEEIKIEIKSKK